MTNILKIKSSIQTPLNHNYNYIDDFKYQETLIKNKGWMNTIDGMDGNQDGWLKADFLYQQFPGLKKELSGVDTKYENGSVFFNSSQMAKFITNEYNK